MGDLLPPLPASLGAADANAWRRSRFGSWLEQLARPLGGGHETERVAEARPDPRRRGSVADHEELCCRVDMHLRRLFLRIDRYLLLSRIDSELHRLESLVQSMLIDAQECFALAARLDAAADAPLPSPDQQDCIVELQVFMRELQSGRPLPPIDVLHALDGLLVQCVVLDSRLRG